MSNFLLILAELSIAAAIFYGIYHLSMKLFKKKITKQCRYILCLLVVFRMLVPFGVNIDIPWESVSVHLFGPAPEKAVDVVTFKDDAFENIYEDDIRGVPGQESVSDGNNEESMLGALIAGAVFGGDDSHETGAASDDFDGIQNEGILRGIMKHKMAEFISAHWEIILFSIWLIGAVIYFACYEFGYLRWKHLILKGSRPAEPKDDDLLERMYPKGYVDLLQSAQVSTPLLCGAICPYIILPEGGFVGNGKQDMLEHILRHEMYHVKRQDLAWKHLAILGRSIHWFNPFLHSVCDELSRCCELSCDEAVTRNMDKNSARVYGETILTLASGVLANVPTLVNGFCHEKEELKERLEGIMNNRKLSGRVLALSLVLVLLMSGCGTVLAPDQGVFADTVNALMPEDDSEEYVGEENVDTASSENMSAENIPVESESSSMEKAEETETAADVDEENPLLLSDIQREYVGYDACDTMYIMVAGQETKLFVKDMENIFNPSETPEYDVNKFVTMAANALEHLYELSGYRSDSWNVSWSSRWNDLSFTLSDFAKCEEFYWISYANAYSEAVLGEEVKDNWISNMGFVFSERRDYSPISWDDMKKPNDLKSMSMEEAAQWYYENYLVYDAAEVDTVLLTDANLGGKGAEAEVYTVDGEAFYIHLMEDKSFSSIYGPYPHRSYNHWRNAPEGLEDTFEDSIF